MCLEAKGKELTISKMSSSEAPVKHSVWKPRFNKEAYSLALSVP